VARQASRELLVTITAPDHRHDDIGALGGTPNGQPLGRRRLAAARTPGQQHERHV
jgi:hypothetical protein